MIVAREDRHVSALLFECPHARSRGAARADYSTARIPNRAERVAQWRDESCRVRVVAKELIAADHDGIAGANLATRRINPVELLHHDRFVRRGHAQAVEIPVEFARLRVNHPAKEFNTVVVDFERDIHGVQFVCRKSCVMNVRRERVTYPIADNSEDLSVAIDAIDSV